MKRVLLLGSQHGNELLGEQLYGRMKAFHSIALPYVEYLLANPQAHHESVRYIESDMNRSYVDHPQTYEERLAQGVLDYISSHRFDLILDLHTTTCEQSPCFIVSKMYRSVIDYIEPSDIQKVVVMPQKITQHSLIGNVANALSVEVQASNIDDEMLTHLTSEIEAYVHGVPSSLKGKKKEFYEVDDLIYKNELQSEQIKNLRNFELSEYGYYPVLVGENSYKKYTNYLGFRARKVN